MTEFAETAMRHYCRNDRIAKNADNFWKACRTKLKKPVENLNRAFCCRSCYESFYRRHCRVCNRSIEQPKHGERLVCKRSGCRTAYQQNRAYYEFDPSKTHPRIVLGETSSKNAHFTGVGEASGGRKWRQIAGPPLTPNQFHCAAVPDGPNCRWEGGAYERIEASNRAALKAAEQAEIEASGEFTEPEWREVISPDGVRCFVTRFRGCRAPAPIAPKIDADRVKALIEQIPDDLSIPTFLRRVPL